MVLLTILYGGWAFLLAYFSVSALHNFMEDCGRWEAPDVDHRRDLAELLARMPQKDSAILAIAMEGAFLHGTRKGPQKGYDR